MALLTAEEKEKLAKEGVWVREKCDCCHKPILSPVSFIKKEKVFCAGCAKGQDLVLANTKEENEMATKKAEKKAAGKTETTKIFGVIIPETAIADLALFLEDEKKHSLKDTLKAINPKHKADKLGRLKQLQRYGKQKGLWSVTIDENTVQLKMGKGAPAPKAAKKEEKPAKKGTKKEEPEETEVGSSKQQKVVQRLVRGVLKDTGKQWTKSKVIEKLKDEHDLEPKRVQEAIQTEIKLGGILIKDGLLSLV